MGCATQFLNASEAAKRLGVSPKALRLYEQRGLIAPSRTAAGWRAYGPEAMARAAEIASLRKLGLSLAQIERVLGGNPLDLEAALATHQAVLEHRAQEIAAAVEKIRHLRAGLADGRAPTSADLAHVSGFRSGVSVAFDLPWPWGGEHFEIHDIRRLNYITGPLGSGKTRLARCLAETLPDARFVGLERLQDVRNKQAQMFTSPALKARVQEALTWLTEDGTKESEALIALLIELETKGPSILVIDMVEQDLEHAAQEAIIAHLRHRWPRERPLFLMTRSSAILDLTEIGDDEAIIFCPANHSPPTYVVPRPWTAGYETIATCLASPEVRARLKWPLAAADRAAAHN